MRIVHKHFKDGSEAEKSSIMDMAAMAILDPTISERVRDAAYAFRKRTPCADGHLVIEMLRELDQDI